MGSVPDSRTCSGHCLRHRPEAGAGSRFSPVLRPQRRLFTATQNWQNMAFAQTIGITFELIRI